MNTLIKKFKIISVVKNIVKKRKDDNTDTTIMKRYDTFITETNPRFRLLLKNQTFSFKNRCNPQN